MKKLIITFIFVLIFTPNLFSQTIFEHSNDFEQMHEYYRQRLYNIAENYNYFNLELETVYFPVLNEENKKIVGKDKFFILWIGSDIVDINMLFFCNSEAKEAIVFFFRNEFLEDFIPCSRINISKGLILQIFPKYKDPKWFVIPNDN
jgi:hypothetical protein